YDRCLERIYPLEVDAVWQTGCDRTETTKYLFDFRPCFVLDGVLDTVRYEDQGRPLVDPADDHCKQQCGIHGKFVKGKRTDYRIGGGKYGDQSVVVHLAGQVYQYDFIS